MKSNITNMKNGVARSGEFSYTQTPRTLNAYGKEYPIPVRTTEFSDKLDVVRELINSAKKTSETVNAMKEGIALFIGIDETERIFPNEKLNDIDVDEILGFWLALNFELSRSQNETIARYTPKK